MARFRNAHKRWDPRTGQKKSYPGDELAKVLRGVLAEKKIRIASIADLSHGSVQEFVLTEVVADDGDVQVLGGAPIAGEVGVKFVSFWFSRLRRWLQGLWSAPRWTHPAAWLLAGQKRAWPS